MSAKPRKPFTNAAVAIVLSLLLLVLYVGSWVATAVAFTRDYISLETFDALNGTVFVPINWYQSTDLPGSDALFWLKGQFVLD